MKIASAIKFVQNHQFEIELSESESGVQSLLIWIPFTKRGDDGNVTWGEDCHELPIRNGSVSKQMILQALGY